MLEARDKSREMLEAIWDKLEAFGIMDSDDEQAAPGPHTGTEGSPSGDLGEVDAEEEPALSEPASLEAGEEEQSHGTGKAPSGVPRAAHCSVEHMAAGAETDIVAEEAPKADGAPAVHGSAAGVGRAQHSSAAAAVSTAAGVGTAHSSSANLSVADAGVHSQQPRLVSAGGSVSQEIMEVGAEEPRYLAEAHRAAAEEQAGAVSL